MAEDQKKMNTESIGQYLVAKNGKTKYIKLSAKPKADAKTKKLVEDLIALLGSDRIYVNIFDKEFKEKYDIKDFVKGRIEVDIDAVGTAAPSTEKSASKSKDEVDF